jgi:hypothetical protein
MVITIDLSVGRPLESRMILEGGRAFRNAVLYVLYHSLQSRIGNATLDVVDILKIVNVSDYENVEHNVVVARLNVTAGNTTAEDVYAYCKLALEGLDSGETNDLSIFLMEYYNERYGSASSTISTSSMRTPNVAPGFSFYAWDDAGSCSASEESSSFSSSASDSGSGGDSLGFAAGVGIGVAAFVGFCVVALIVTKLYGSKRSDADGSSKPITFAPHSDI